MRLVDLDPSWWKAMGHGHDDEFPGSTACINCEDCIAFDWDGERPPSKDVRANKMAAKRGSSG